MALTIRFKFAGRCPYHPRYNPKKSGEGGIKAGCRLCGWLHSIYAHIVSAEHHKKILEGASYAENNS